MLNGEFTVNLLLLFFVWLLQGFVVILIFVGIKTMLHSNRGWFPLLQVPSLHLEQGRAISHWLNLTFPLIQTPLLFQAPPRAALQPPAAEELQRLHLLLTSLWIIVSLRTFMFCDDTNGGSRSSSTYLWKKKIPILCLKYSLTFCESIHCPGLSSLFDVVPALLVIPIILYILTGGYVFLYRLPLYIWSWAHQFNNHWYWRFHGFWFLWNSIHLNKQRTKYHHYCSYHYWHPPS